jgi:plastocyanin
MAQIFYMMVALLCLVPPPSLAGVIRGTVHVPGSSPTVAASMNAYPGRAGFLPGAYGTQRGRVSDAIVYVEHVPAQAESALASIKRATPQLAQKGQSFVPRVLAVAVGTKVDFPNKDPIYHNVFSLSPILRFDLGKYPHGGSKQVLFSKVGLVNIYCDIHSGMEAFVMVLPHHAFARPGQDGNYALPDLPAGHYVVRSWHPDLGERTMAVEIPAKGSVTADLSY